MLSTLTEAIQIATIVSDVEATEAGKVQHKDGDHFAICFNCKEPGHIVKNCHQHNSYT